MPRINLNEKKPLNNQKFRFVSLIATSGCSLSCSYCYEKHELRDKKIIELSLAKESLTYYMNEEGTTDVEIEFFGGEPLLAFDLIRDTVDWFLAQNWEKKYRFHIGTNGTILSDDIKAWLYKNREIVNVGISLDGTKTAHDLCRSNSYDEVMKNLPFFLKYWPNQPAKMTICADTIPYVADGVIELEEMGLLFTANIGFEDQWGDENNKKKLLDIYEEQLSRLVDYYVERTHLYPVGLILTSFPGYLAYPFAEDKNSKEIKRFCGSGHEMVVIDVDGKQYPCHRFVPWITKKDPPPGEVNCQTAWKPDTCARCKLVFSCPTCAGFNWEVHGDTGIRTTFHCESFKLEVLASCLLEWKRLRNRIDNIKTMTIEEKKLLKTRADAISNLIETGI